MCYRSEICEIPNQASAIEMVTIPSCLTGYWGATVLYATCETRYIDWLKSYNFFGCIFITMLNKIILVLNQMFHIF